MDNNQNSDNQNTSSTDQTSEGITPVVIRGAQMKPGIIDPRHLVVPTTPKLGDMFYSDGTVFKKLSPGTTGQVLTTSTTGAPSYATPGFSSGCSVYASGNQTISTATLIKIHFDTEVYDLGGEFDNVTNYRFTALAAGKYLTTCTAYIPSLSSGKEMRIDIYKNGSVYKQVFYQSAGDADMMPGITAIIDLAVGEYIEFFVAHDNGSDLTLTGQSQSTYAMIQRLI